MTKLPQLVAFILRLQSGSTAAPLATQLTFWVLNSANGKCNKPWWCLVAQIQGLVTLYLVSH